MSDDQSTGFYPNGDGGSELLRSLPEDLRRAYEAECDRLETWLQHDSPSLVDLVADIRAEQPIRLLVLIHLGKLWLETERREGRTPQVAALLEEVAELKPSWAARAELERWDRLLAGEAPTEAGTPIDVHGKTFLLPKEYELVERIQDQPRRMCLVLLVRDRRLRRLEVLKAINPAKRCDPRAIERFLHEPVRASQTRHQAIVRVYKASDPDARHPYYTMEYLEGGTLGKLVESGPLPPLQAVRYLTIVARALHHIHTSHGLAHGDIKPENILLDGEGNPKLTDFGLSKAMTPEAGASYDDHHESPGTIGYLAPELLDPKYRSPALDIPAERIATDQFALGATLYYCLTRELPYQPDINRLSLFGPINNELTPLGVHNPSIDAKLQAICHKLLERRPDRRFQSAGELAATLEAWLSHQTLEQPGLVDLTFSGPSKKEEPAGPSAGDSVGRVSTGTTPWRKFRVGLAALAAVVLLVVVNTVYRLIADDKPSEEQGKSVARKPRVFESEADDESKVEEPKQPKDASRTTLERFDQRGWAPRPAEAVLKLNEVWLAAVSSKNPGYARVQVDHLARLGESGVPLDFCLANPHYAAMLTTLGTRDEHRALAGALRPVVGEAPDLVARLFTLYPSPGEAPTLLRLLQQDRTLLADLARESNHGPEVALLRAGSYQEDRVYQQWLEEVIREHLVVGDRDKDRRRAAEFQAYVVIQGRALRRRLSADQEFRDRFLGELWPAFVDLIKGGVFDLSDVLEIDQIWDYLAREREPGRQALRDLQLAPVALFYGPHAADYPTPELHARILELLRTRNKIVVEAIFDDRFKSLPAFRKLLLMPRLDVRVLATVIGKARQDSTLLNSYAEWTSSQLAEEFEQVLDPLAAARVDGLWVYVELPRRLLVGKGMPSYVWWKLARQAVGDLSEVALASMGAPPGTAKAIAECYNAANAAVSAIEAAEHKRLAGEVDQKLSPGTMLVAPKGAGDSSSNSSVRLFEQIRKMVDYAKTLDVHDAAPIVRMYKSMISEVDPRANAADRADVRLLTFKGGRVAPALADGGPAGPIRQFFRERAEILTRSPAASEAERQRAWQESVSAWWLMHATRQLDLLD